MSPVFVNVRPGGIFPFVMLHTIGVVPFAVSCWLYASPTVIGLVTVVVIVGLILKYTGSVVGLPSESVVEYADAAIVMVKSLLASPAVLEAITVKV